MKKNLIVLSLATMALTSCGGFFGGNSRPATGAEKDQAAAALKAAAEAEGNKSTAYYELGGSVSFKRMVGRETAEFVAISGLNAKLNIRHLTGGILGMRSSSLKNAKVGASLSYSKLDMGWNEGDTSYTVNAPSGTAKAWLVGNAGYLDLTGLDIANIAYNGEMPEVPTSVKVSDAATRYSFDSTGMNIPALDDLGDEDLNTYVLPLITYNKGEAYDTAHLEIDRTQIETLYASIRVADWMVTEMNKIPEDMRDNALIATKDLYLSEIRSMIPEFHFALDIRYTSAGVMKVSLDLSGKVNPDALDSTVPAEKKNAFDFNVDLDLDTLPTGSVEELPTRDWVEIA